VRRTYHTLGGVEMSGLGKKRWGERWSTWSILERNGVVRSRWEVGRHFFLAWNKLITRTAEHPQASGITRRIEYRRTVDQ
jgi:hypothetical protein